MFTYTYDDEGNRLTKANVQSYLWDHRNRLIQAPMSGMMGNGYTYDYLNRIVFFNGSTFIHDGWQIVVKMDATGIVQERYFWGASQDEFIAEEFGGTLNWTLCDHLGSVRDVVNSSGTVLNHFEYNAFGKLINATSNLYVPTFLYTAKLFDNQTNLQWNINRWYDANVGRWISEDPIGFNAGDRNLYRYVGNNSLRLVDYFGYATSAIFPNNSSARVISVVRKNEIISVEVEYTLYGHPVGMTYPILRVIQTHKFECRPPAGAGNSTVYDYDQCNQEDRNSLDRCAARVQRVGDNSKKVQELVSEIKKKCRNPNIKFDCVFYSGDGLRGMYGRAYIDKRGVNCIQFNADRIHPAQDEEIEGWFVHELTHLSQYCNRNRGRGCGQGIQDEFEAYLAEYQSRYLSMSKDEIFDHLISHMLLSVCVGGQCKIGDISAKLLDAFLQKIDQLFPNNKMLPEDNVPPVLPPGYPGVIA